MSTKLSEHEKNPALHRILEHTRQRIKLLKADAKMYEPMPYVPSSKSIVDGVRSAKRERGFGLIAEVKPASPTASFARITPRTAAELAYTMQQAGACAISVLTEPDVFCGSLANLNLVKARVSVPVLRKDFILSPIQLTEAYQDSVLLIASLVDELPQMVEQCQRLGMEPLVEVRTMKEAEAALDAKATLLGVNNRDLATLKTDISATLSLAPAIKQMDEKVVLISESGISSAGDVRKVVAAGADGALVGTTLMRDISCLYDATHTLVHSVEVST
ncbi:MAG: indole-3-glycerol-phosphate synthase [Methermicoccaceae archaeon]